MDESPNFAAEPYDEPCQVKGPTMGGLWACASPDDPMRRPVSTVMPSHIFSRELDVVLFAKPPAAIPMNGRASFETGTLFTRISMLECFDKWQRVRVLVRRRLPTSYTTSQCLNRARVEARELRGFARLLGRAELLRTERQIRSYL